MIFGNFTLNFAYFAHFMHFRSTICYDIPAFSRGKFISKELICVKYLTFCNSVQVLIENLGGISMQCPGILFKGIVLEAERADIKNQLPNGGTDIFHEPVYWKAQSLPNINRPARHLLRF